MKYHLILVRMANIKKNLQRTNAREDVKKRELSYTVDGEKEYQVEEIVSKGRSVGESKRY